MDCKQGVTKTYIVGDLTKENRANFPKGRKSVKFLCHLNGKHVRYPLQKRTARRQQLAATNIAVDFIGKKQTIRHQQLAAANQAADFIRRKQATLNFKEKKAANLIKRAVRSVGNRKRQMKRAAEEQNDKFIFFSKSADVAPGKGKSTSGNEHVDRPSDYSELSKIPDWRKMLSNFDVAEFEWTGEGILSEPFPAGTRWRSIEHVFQSAKFWMNAQFVAGVLRRDPKSNKMKAYTPEEFKAAALRFTMNSGDPIGQGDGADAQKGRKLLWLEEDDMRRWDAISNRVMESAATAKYTQNPDRMRMLKLTAPAQLVHLMTQRGKMSKTVRFNHLEAIRSI